MLTYKDNISYIELLDYAEYLVEKYSTTRDEDITQIDKFREIIRYKSPGSDWLNFIEGWVSMIDIKYGENVYRWLRKEKLKKLKTNN